VILGGAKKQKGGGKQGRSVFLGVKKLFCGWDDYLGVRWKTNDARGTAGKTLNVIGLGAWGGLDRGQKGVGKSSGQGWLRRGLFPSGWGGKN